MNWYQKHNIDTRLSITDAGQGINILHYKMDKWISLVDSQWHNMLIINVKVVLSKVPYTWLNKVLRYLQRFELAIEGRRSGSRIFPKRGA